MKKTIRLDKYLSQLGIVSRRGIKKALESQWIWVDWERVFKSDLKISYWQTISVYTNWDFLNTDQDSQKELFNVEVKESIYIMLHKPSGFVSSELDEWWHKSYKTLLANCPYVNMLHVAWRLDFDTEWVLLCTTDWQRTHQIISPKKDLEKEYYIETNSSLSEQDLEKLQQGVVLDDGYKTLPAKAFFVTQEKNKLHLIITEGKFHQVKRMINAVWSEVTYLRRERVWKRTLGDLESGKWIYIEN